MITFKHKGNFEKTTKFLKRVKSLNIKSVLEKYGKVGVNALKEATPKDTGKTSESWTYNVTVTKTLCRIDWRNTNIVDGVPIALILQYGHATRNGGYVDGIDYINPTMKPIFEDILNKVWKEVVDA